MPPTRYLILLGFAHALSIASGRLLQAPGSARGGPKVEHEGREPKADALEAVVGAHRGLALLAPYEAYHAELSSKAEAAAQAEAAAANRVDATRLIYTASQEVESFALAGGADGMQLVLWGCIAALVSIMAISAVFISMHYQYQSSRRDPTSENLSDLFPLRAPWQNTGQRWSQKSSSDVASSDNYTGSSARTSTDTQQQQSGAVPPGLQLCPLLIVPDGTRLACIVQNDVRHKRQELSFDVVALPTRSGAPLFTVRISELGRETPGVYVETLSGREQLAFLSTEEVWKGVPNPVCTISRPWGLPYGTIQKSEDGAYHVNRGKTALLVFSGDFQNHKIQVRNSRGVVAQTESTSPEEYQVRIQARTDAGLVILGLLAIDKCEVNHDGKGSSGSSDPVL